MAAPGVSITRQDTPPPRSADTDTGKLFIIGMADDGPYDEAVEVTSLAQFVDTFGDRQTYSTLYDEIDLFFHEGGARAFVARYTGPAGTNDSTDRGNVTNTERTAALDLFTADLGPGQVKVAGGTNSGFNTASVHALVQDHAETYGRIAVLDATDTSTVATLTTLATSDRSPEGARDSGLFWPHVTIPPIVGGGSDRTVPPGAFYAAVAARNDGLGISPNNAVAGDLGASIGYVTGLSQVGLPDADRDTLSAAGVTVIRELSGVVRIYDDTTLADPASEPNWVFLSNARFFTKIRAEAQFILEGFLFRQIDGRGHLLSEVKGALTGLLIPYFNDGSLYGDTPEEAFNVDMSGNTDESIADGNLTASLALRMSPPAKNIEMAIIKVAVSGSVA